MLIFSMSKRWRFSKEFLARARLKIYRVCHYPGDRTYFYVDIVQFDLPNKCHIHGIKKETLGLTVLNMLLSFVTILYRLNFLVTFPFITSSQSNVHWCWNKSLILLSISKTSNSFTTDCYTFFSFVNSHHESPMLSILM